MKDFLIAEYKTIILVLVFCAGIFSWFYVRELEKDAQKNAKTDWAYTCMEPGRGVNAYHVGDAAPAFDDSWERVEDVPGITMWRQNGGELAVSVRDGHIWAIEYAPKDEALRSKCVADLEHWTASHPLNSAPISAGENQYLRYPGVVDIMRSHDGETTHQGWIINSIM